MKPTVCTAVAIALTMAATEAQEVEITSLARNGDITWTCPPGSVCTVEWAPELVSSTAWARVWTHLDGIRATQAVTKARVPMFYRVVCETNGHLQPMRVGAEWTYTVSNGNARTWTLTETVAGVLLSPAIPNKYYMVTRFQTWDDPKPSGVDYLWYDSPASLVRSTPDSLFELQGPFERRALYDAPPGTVWTNQILHFDEYGDLTIEGTVAGTTNITVPAGTFSCKRCDLVVTEVDTRSQIIAYPGMTCTDWIAHDLGLVKRITSMPNLIGSASPLTYELQSIKR